MQRKRSSLQTSPISRRKTEIQNQRLIAPAAEVVEQLVHNKQQAMIGKFLVEGGHHGFQGSFVLANFVGRRELESHAPLGQLFFQVAGDDVAQGHFG
jgi:hypothetical protein